MFLQNKYSSWYYNIIKGAQSQQRKKGEHYYYESHHIIPRSMGGSDRQFNRVLLTPREHYICHLLLIRMVEGVHVSKMFTAILLMSGRKIYQTSSRSYEYHRTNYIDSIKGSNSPHYGKGRKLSESHKKKISSGRKGIVFSEETRSKMAAKRKQSDIQEWSERMTEARKHKNGNIGKKRTAEQRLKNSLAHKGKIQSRESNEKRSLALKGRKNGPRSEETKAKMREAWTRRKSNSS